MRQIIVTNNGFRASDMELLLSRPQPQAVIYAGRNMLWTAECHGQLLAIKSFCSNMKSRIVYRFRRSKARRSYENARILLSRGISTPEPIAWIERRNGLGMLVGSWYISRYENRMCLRDALIEYGDSCLSAFAEFVAMLHDNGIRHDDLNNTNVRVWRHSDGAFSFDLIDLNRMKLRPDGHKLQLDESLRNICRFCAYDERFVSFVRTYASSRNLPESIIIRAIAVKRRHERRGRIRQWIKKRL